jgi:hypothetical protein
VLVAVLAAVALLGVLRGCVMVTGPLLVVVRLVVLSVEAFLLCANVVVISDF